MIGSFGRPTSPEKRAPCLPCTPRRWRRRECARTATAGSTLVCSVASVHRTHEARATAAPFRRLRACIAAAPDDVSKIHAGSRRRPLLPAVWRCRATTLRTGRGCHGCNRRVPDIPSARGLADSRCDPGGHASGAQHRVIRLEPGTRSSYAGADSLCPERARSRSAPEGRLPPADTSSR